MDLCFQDPDDDQKSKNELFKLLKAKLVKNNQNFMDWSNIIYKESLEFIPKSKFIKKSNLKQINFKTIGFENKNWK